ncbi:MAG: hypothetical protein KAH13_04130 [Tenericutes bacterium]|nr:hypothetical protein [Mycoplasmatota bacterium]
MKKFLQEKGLIIVLWLVLIIVFVVGGLYTNKMIESKKAEDIAVLVQRYYDEIDLIDLEYNFDSESFGTSPYIVTFTYEGSTYTTYLNINFNYVSTIEGEEQNLIVMTAVKHHAEQEQLKQNTAHLISYDENTRTLVMITEGFAGIITAEIILNTSLDGAEWVTITSNESYNSEFNIAYAGASAPSVEYRMFNQYLNAGTINVDSIAGASEGTGNGMQELITLLDLYVNTLEGGN